MTFDLAALRALCEPTDLPMSSALPKVRAALVQALAEIERLADNLAGVNGSLANALRMQDRYKDEAESGTRIVQLLAEVDRLTALNAALNREQLTYAIQVERETSEAAHARQRFLCVHAVHGASGGYEPCPVRMERDAAIADRDAARAALAAAETATAARIAAYVASESSAGRPIHARDIRAGKWRKP